MATMLAACDNNKVYAKGSSRKALHRRAQAYWDAIVSGDRVAAWPFEEMSLKPEWTLQAYLKRGGMVINSAQVQDDAEINGDQAIVKVQANYSIPLIRVRNHDAELDDHWVLIDGAWYHAHRRSVAHQ